MFSPEDYFTEPFPTNASIYTNYAQFKTDYNTTHINWAFRKSKSGIVHYIVMFKSTEGSDKWTDTVLSWFNREFMPAGNMFTNNIGTMFTNNDQVVLHLSGNLHKTGTTEVNVRTSYAYIFKEYIPGSWPLRYSYILRIRKAKGWTGVYQGSYMTVDCLPGIS